MIKEEIKNTYDILDFLLDLSTYYTTLSSKNINKMINLKLDKRYKKESYIRSKKLEGLEQYNKYLQYKSKIINDMIKNIDNNNIKEVNIKFL